MQPRGFQHRPPGGDRGRSALRGRCNLDHLGPEVGAFYWTVLAPDIVNPGREEQGSVSL